MKTLKDTINEAFDIKLERMMTWDVKSDIYNAIEDVAFKYDQRNKKFDKKDVEAACKWFVSRFFDE